MSSIRFLIGAAFLGAVPLKLHFNDKQARENKRIAQELYDAHRDPVTGPLYEKRDSAWLQEQNAKIEEWEGHASIYRAFVPPPYPKCTDLL